MKKLLFALLATFAMHSHGYTQITFHDINPDTTVSTWNAFQIYPITGNTSNNITIWWHPSPEVVIQTWGDCELLFDASGSLPLKLNLGDSISSLGKWLVGNYHALSSGGGGNWVNNATDKYLGFRVKTSGVWNYGWLKMTVATGATSFTVKEWAFNNTGKKINAGQKTTTGVNTITTHICITVYPNPAQNSIQLQYTANENTSVRIIDINGKIIKAIPLKVGSTNPVVDISELTKGMYNMLINEASQSIYASFVKQ